MHKSMHPGQINTGEKADSFALYRTCCTTVACDFV